MNKREFSKISSCFYKIKNMIFYVIKFYFDVWLFTFYGCQSGVTSALSFNKDIVKVFPIVSANGEKECLRRPLTYFEFNIQISWQQFFANFLYSQQDIVKANLTPLDLFLCDILNRLLENKVSKRRNLRKIVSKTLGKNSSF